MTDWRSSLRSDPTPWLMENASAPICYRVLTELLDRGRDDPEVQKARQNAVQYGPAVQLQRKQRKDGSWGGRIHAGDFRKLEPSLENLLNKLFEYGWRREAKTDPACGQDVADLSDIAKKDLKLFEFAKVVKADERRERYYRWFLRILSLGLLARAGYLEERSRAGMPRAARAVFSGFVDSPVSRDPTEEIGGSSSVDPFGRPGGTGIRSCRISTSCASSLSRPGCSTGRWPRCG